MSSHSTGPIDPSLLPQHDAVHQAFAAYVAQPPSPPGTTAGGPSGSSGRATGSGGGHQRSLSPRPAHHHGVGGGQGSSNRSAVGQHAGGGGGGGGLYDHLGSVVDDGSSVVDVVGLQSLSDAGFHLGGGGGAGPSTRAGQTGGDFGHQQHQQGQHRHMHRGQSAYHPTGQAYGGGGGGRSQAGGTDDGHSTKDGGGGGADGSDRQTTDGGGRGGKKRKRAPNGQGVRTIARRQAEEGASYIHSAAGRATAFKNGIATIEHNMRLLETKTGAMIFYIAALPDEPPHASASPQQWISHTSPALLAPVPADFYVTPSGEPLFPGELDPIQPAEAAAQAHQTLAEAIAALQQRWRAHNPGEPERKKGRPNGGNHHGSAADDDGGGGGGGAGAGPDSQVDDGQQQQQHSGHGFQQQHHSTHPFQQHHLAHQQQQHQHQHQQHAALSAHALEQQQQQQAANDAGEQYLNHHDMTDGAGVGVGGGVGGSHDLPGTAGPAGGSPDSAAAAVAAVVAQQELEQHLQQFSQSHQQQQQQQQAGGGSHSYDSAHHLQPALGPDVGSGASVSGGGSALAPTTTAAAAAAEAAQAAADERALDEALLLGTAGDGAFVGALDMAGPSSSAAVAAGSTAGDADSSSAAGRTAAAASSSSRIGADIAPDFAAQLVALERARAEVDASREAFLREKASWDASRAAVAEGGGPAGLGAAQVRLDKDTEPATRRATQADDDDDDDGMLVLDDGDDGLPDAAADEDEYVMKLE